MGIAIGTISYLAAAVAFLLLSLLLLTKWRGQLQGSYLLLASLLTTIWAGRLAWEAGLPQSLSPLADLLGILRSMGWSAFLIVVLSSSGQTAPLISGKMKRWLINLAALCTLIAALTLYAHTGATALHQSAEFWGGVVGRVALALTGLVLVEQLYRNTTTQQRWAIKFLVLGLGGMFAYDFYLYADAMLFRRIDMDLWNARGIIDALIVPLLAISAARNPTWALNIAVSRRILFHSTALLGAGIYLLLMAAAGYYIRYFGGSWGGVLQVIFLFGALLILLTIVFSGSLRARLRVFLSKHFFSYRYDYREEWLRFTRTLSAGEPGVQLRERAVQALAQLVESPGGALWMVQDKALFERVAHWNMAAAAGSEAVDSDFCRFFQTYPWIIDLDEHAATPERYPGLSRLPAWLPALPGARLVVPLIQQDSLLGFIVLLRSHAPFTINWETRDILKTAGRQAASFLAQIEAARALLLARQFESFNRMSAFVVHDIKNLAAQLSLLVSNAERHRHNPEFQQDMLDTIGHSAARMKRLLVQLRPGGATPEQIGVVLLDPLLSEAVSNRTGYEPAPVFDAQCSGLSVLAHAERLERVLGHLILNAIEATPRQGQVSLRLLRQEQYAVIEVSDTGCGMSEQFIREKLFAPFESAKPAGMGIGVYECREYVRELGGHLEVNSREHYGSTFRVLLPLASHHQPHLPPDSELLDSP